MAPIGKCPHCAKLVLFREHGCAEPAPEAVAAPGFIRDAERERIAAALAENAARDFPDVPRRELYDYASPYLRDLYWLDALAAAESRAAEVAEERDRAKANAWAAAQAISDAQRERAALAERLAAVEGLVSELRHERNHLAATLAQREGELSDVGKVLDDVAAWPTPMALRVATALHNTQDETRRACAEELETEARRLDSVAARYAAQGDEEDARWVPSIAEALREFADRWAPPAEEER